MNTHGKSNMFTNLDIFAEEFRIQILTTPSISLDSPISSGYNDQEEELCFIISLIITPQF
jgi:hypothetical protein